MLVKKFSLRGFTNIDTATFQSVYAVTDLLGVTILDDMEYNVYCQGDADGQGCN